MILSPCRKLGGSASPFVICCSALFPMKLPGFQICHLHFDELISCLYPCCCLSRQAMRKTRNLSQVCLSVKRASRRMPFQEKPALLLHFLVVYHLLSQYLSFDVVLLDVLVILVSLYLYLVIDNLCKYYHHVHGDKGLKLIVSGGTTPKDRQHSSVVVFASLIVDVAVAGSGLVLQHHCQSRLWLGVSTCEFYV